MSGGDCTSMSYTEFIVKEFERNERLVSTFTDRVAFIIMTNIID